MPVNYNRYDKEVIELLQGAVLPWWEQFGLSHLVQSANTLAEFKRQRLPDQIRTSVKKRHSDKVLLRGSYHFAKWPKDGQTAIRYPQFVCVLKGQADFHIADYVVHCPQRHFLLFRPQVPYPSAQLPHLERSTAHDDLEKRYAEVLWFNSKPGDNNRIRLWTCHSQGARHWAKPRFDFCFIERSEVMQLYHLFIQELIEKPLAYQGISHAVFLSFLRLFIRELKLGNFHYGGSLNSTEFAEEGSSPIEIAQQYIARHLNQHLTTANVADAVYMSRANFVRRFREQTGQTFNQYLTARRIEEAKHFLTQEKWQIAEISQFVGLKPAQLRNLFLQHLGKTPSEFRHDSITSKN